MKHSEFKGNLETCRNCLVHILKCEKMITDLYDEMANVKAIQYDKIPGTPNPQSVEQRRLEYSEKISLVEDELNEVRRIFDPLEEFMLEKLKRLDYTITCVNVQEALLYQYGLKIEGDKLALGVPHSLRIMINKYPYSVNGMWQLLKREIEKL